MTKKRLVKKPWIAEYCESMWRVPVSYNAHQGAVTPEFGVACRRPTSGPGYLEALCEDNVGPIARRLPILLT